MFHSYVTMTQEQVATVPLEMKFLCSDGVLLFIFAYYDMNETRDPMDLIKIN